MEKISCIILARGGSKRLPRKQLKLLGGKPMMDYVCLEALKVFKKVYFSCDDKKINNHAKKLGMTIIKRPLLFTDDTTPAIQGLRYIINRIEGETFMLLSPCCPLLTEQDIRNAISLYEENNYSSLVSVVKSQDAHPSKVCFLDGGDMVSEEDMRVWQTKHDNSVSIYRRNAALYIFKKCDILTNPTIFNGNIGVYIMPPERSADINTELDFKITETLLK